MAAGRYKCVNCGEPAVALYKEYGPSVLKLTKCESCKGTVDKYIEYDPVIVMIDLVLMSREAQRHVIYNTEFKSYWKLFVILTMLETYGVWRSDSLFNITINSMCGIPGNITLNITQFNLPFEVTVPEYISSKCWAWIPQDRGDEVDLFIWEKDFYIQFIATLAGIIVFVVMGHSLMTILSSSTRVCTVRVLKAFSLGDVSILLTLPMLVWGNADTSPQTRTVHYTLVFLYSFVMFTSVFTVLYNSPKAVAIVVLMIISCAKYATSFHVTPHVRELMS